MRAIPDSEIDVRLPMSLDSPSTPRFWEPLLFIMAAIEKLVILDSKGVGVFGCISDVLGIKIKGFVVAEDVVLGDVEEYVGEDDLSS